MEERRGRLLRHTLDMASMTALSRILGYLRDRVVASLLGTTFLADAFYIAFRIPNTFRRFVGEGAMTAALVPVLSESFRKDGEAGAWLFARRFLYTFGAFLAIFGALGVLGAPLLVKALAWEFQGKAPEVYGLTVRLTALLFPYITLVSLAAVAMGILNCREVFGPPAFTPVLLNLAIIAAAVLWGKGSEDPTTALAWGVLAGGALQFIFQLPYLKRAGMPLAPAFSWRDSRVRKVGALMLPGMLGAGVSQLTLLVGTALAHTVGEGAVSALYYSNRVTELAFGIFAVSISQVILPRMSQQVAGAEKRELEKTMGQALSGLFFILLPATAGILALCRPIVRVLFETGKFSEESVRLTTGPLAAYALGMALWGAATILVRACHAHQDMTTPFWAGLWTLAAYVALALALMPALGATGIALASSVTALVNGGWVALALRRRHGVRVPWKAAGASFLRALLLSAAMAGGVWLLYGALPQARLLHAALSLFGSIFAGVVFYGAAAFLFRFPEAEPGRAFLKRAAGRLVKKEGEK